MRITDFQQLILPGAVAPQMTDSVSPPIFDWHVAFPSADAAAAWLEQNRPHVDILGNEWLSGQIQPGGPALVLAAIRSREPIAFPTGAAPLNPAIVRRLLGDWQ